MSSATPRTHTSAPPARMDQAALDAAKTPERNGIRDAKSRATANPSSMATPPRRGVGTVCTSRSRTAVTAPVRIASQRAIGVVRYVTAAAMSMTSR